ncbi:MAG: ABC transporter substrate-binding protein [Anaerolineae bacterium]|nr:ABC transporter substrate-binding protein [Anaerolineae bacterium]
MLLSLTGCQPAEPETIIVTQVVEVEGETIIETVEVPVEVEVEAEGPIEIAVIVKTGNSSFWQNVQTGAMDAQEELKELTPGLSVTFLGAQSESNINEQINIVESAIDRGVEAIVLAPSDVSALIPVVEKANEAGIAVIIIDSALEGPEDNYLSFLATDNDAAGRACAQRMIEEVVAKTGSDEGKIAIMSYVAGVGSEVGRVGGFTEYIEENSNLEIVTVQYSNSDMPTALDQTTNVLTANPDLVGIFGANEPTAIGMGRAIEQAGLAGEIVAIGFDGNSVLAEMVTNGTLQAIAVQSSYNMGYLGVMTAYQAAIEGVEVEHFVDTGFVIVDVNNIESDEAKNVLY